MDRDSLSMGNATVLCEQSAALRDTLNDLRTLAQTLQVEARAAQDVAQEVRDASKVLIAAARRRRALVVL